MTDATAFVLRTTIWALLASLPISAAACSAKRTPQTVYQSRFSAMLGEWSPQTIEQSPNRRRTFLGGFVEEPVTLKLADLPPHAYVRALRSADPDDVGR